MTPRTHRALNRHLVIIIILLSLFFRGTSVINAADEDPRKDKFVKFMTEFYPAFVKKDWEQMRRLSIGGKPGDYCEMLFSSAKILAKPNWREVGSEWSKENLLNSADHIELALSLIAASQGKGRAEDARLSPEQDKAVKEVVAQLLTTANDPNTQTFERKEKREMVAKIYGMTGSNAQSLSTLGTTKHPFSSEASLEAFVKDFYALHVKADRKGMKDLCRDRLEDAKRAIVAVGQTVEYFDRMKDHPALGGTMIGDKVVTPNQLRAMVRDLANALDVVLKEAK